MSDERSSYVVIQEGHTHETEELSVPLRWHKGILQQLVRITTWKWTKGECKPIDRRDEWRCRLPGPSVLLGDRRGDPGAGLRR